MAITILNMLINIIVMVYSSIRQLRLYIQLAKAKYARWQARNGKQKPGPLVTQDLFTADDVYQT